MEPVIRQTTLATSIIAYFGRIPWEEVSLQIIARPIGTPISELFSSGEILDKLCASAFNAAETLGDRSCLTATLLLRQVRNIVMIFF